MLSLARVLGPLVDHWRDNLSDGASSMDNEPYRDLTHAQMIDTLAAHARRQGHEAYREFRLPSGKVADVLVKTKDGNLEIIEVKTEWRTSLAEIAVLKYWTWCHRLHIAVPAWNDVGTLARDWPTRWSTKVDQCGIIEVDRCGIGFLRPGVTHPMLHEQQREIMLLLNPRC